MNAIALARITTELLSSLHAEKDFKQVLQAKKDLKDLNTDDLDFLPRGTRILKGTKSQSLCPYYRILWSKSKRLHSMGIINSIYISVGTVKV